MPVKYIYHQISLKDVFSDCQDMFVDDALIRKRKTFYKDKPEVDPYSMAYRLILFHAASCLDAKQMYINGHFCYADKFVILTNGLSVVRHIAFTENDDFKKANPELTVEKKRIPLLFYSCKLLTQFFNKFYGKGWNGFLYQFDRCSILYK